MRARHPGMLLFEQNGRPRAFLARLAASERTELAGGKSHSRQVTPKTNNSLHIASVHDEIFWLLQQAGQDEVSGWIPRI